uniref:Uncharacterized protein n=1 Tax=Arion vulgaris TaxID=1028688 RepID=A0A0B7AL08_9EUPU
MDCMTPGVRGREQSRRRWQKDIKETLSWRRQENLLETDSFFQAAVIKGTFL